MFEAIAETAIFSKFCHLRSCMWGPHWHYDLARLCLDIYLEHIWCFWKHVKNNAAKPEILELIGNRKFHSLSLGTGRELKEPTPKIREQEGNKKIHSQISGMGREWKKPIPKIREQEGNEKNPFPKFGNGKGMKKSIPKVRERESEASILGNDREGLCSRIFFARDIDTFWISICWDPDQLYNPRWPFKNFFCTRHRYNLN